MTLQQLKYVIYIAESGSLSKASEIAFISQPSLSATLKDLEKEIGIQIFSRNNRGLQLTLEGNEFLAYARQVILQYSLIEEKYLKTKEQKKKFSISMQHYSFAVKAFIHMAKEFNMEEYEFALRETKTYEVIDDVRYFRSELGILYLNEFNQSILTKLFKEYDIDFYPLFSCKVYVYLWSGNPLAEYESISLTDLEEYPCLSFEQGNQNAFYFSEEVLSTYDYKRFIKVNDRATMLNLMKGLLGYTFCSGILSEDLNGGEYHTVPLESDEIMQIGYIKKKNIPCSKLANIYIEEIHKTYDGYNQNL